MANENLGYLIAGIVIALLCFGLGMYSGVQTTKRAFVKTECARYNPNNGMIEMKKNGAW